MTLYRRLALTIVFSTAVIATSSWAFKGVSVGDPMKDFALETLDGRVVRLSESLGPHATLVTFWATWSPRSSEALADFQSLHRQHGDKLGVVAVNVERQEWDPSDAQSISETIERVGATYPVVIDRGLSVYGDYGVMAVPSTVLLDRQGTITEVLEGYPTTLRFEFQDKVLAALEAIPEAPQAKIPPETYTPKGKASRYLQMGKVLFGKGKRSKGLQSVRRAIAEDPEYVEAYEYLAEALMFVGRSEEAEEVKRKIASLTGQPYEPAGGSGTPGMASTEREESARAQ